jgi:uncharacterized protein YcaQ
MVRPSFPLRAVAGLFLERQMLDHPRGRRLRASSLRELAERTGGIQMDSINVLDRAHYLTVWSRFGVYDRAKLDDLVYRDRVLFEYWAHAACLVPTSHARWWRRAMLEYRARHTGWANFIRRNPRVLRRVEEALREGGPLGNADFQGRKPRGAEGWWNWKPTTHALHVLWMMGRTLVHSRVHFQKRFDLADRVLPEAFGDDPPPVAEFLRWHLERSLHAMGAATDADLRNYLSYPRQSREERRRTLEAAIKDGTVVEIAVEGDSSRWWALARDLRALTRAAENAAPSRGTALLAPFDSLLWHRERVERLFGFEYRIEVYTPGDRRVHGYYTLPILHDGYLIGRVDAKNHRDQRRLEVKHVQFEPWLARGEAPPAAAWGKVARSGAVGGVADALRSLARFSGATETTLGRVTPRKLEGPVREALESGI